MLFDEQDRHAGLGEIPQDLLHLIDDHRGKTLGGLVEDHQLGVGHERPPDCQHLLLTTRNRGTGRVPALGQNRE